MSSDRSRHSSGVPVEAAAQLATGTPLECLLRSSGLSPGDLLELGHPGLLPLVVLTKGGARREIVDQVFTGLQASGETRFLPVGYMLASLTFGKENVADQEWLHGRYMRMQDILKEAPIYEVMTRDAREEGRQEGRQEGLQEGQQKGLEALRRAVLEIVHARFPQQERLAKKLLAFVDDPLKLQQLIVHQPGADR